MEGVDVKEIDQMNTISNLDIDICDHRKSKNGG